jgi:hypothetical protein
MHACIYVCKSCTCSSIIHFPENEMSRSWWNCSLRTQISLFRGIVSLFYVCAGLLVGVSIYIYTYIYIYMYWLIDLICFDLICFDWLIDWLYVYVHTYVCKYVYGYANVMYVWIRFHVSYCVRCPRSILYVCFVFPEIMFWICRYKWPLCILNLYCWGINNGPIWALLWGFVLVPHGWEPGYQSEPASNSGMLDLTPSLNEGGRSKVMAGEGVLWAERWGQ